MVLRFHIGLKRIVEDSDGSLAFQHQPTVLGMVGLLYKIRKLHTVYEDKPSSLSCFCENRDLLKLGNRHGHKAFGSRKARLF